MKFFSYTNESLLYLFLITPSPRLVCLKYKVYLPLVNLMFWISEPIAKLEKRNLAQKNFLHPESHENACYYALPATAKIMFLAYLEFWKREIISESTNSLICSQYNHHHLNQETPRIRLISQFVMTIRFPLPKAS